MVWACGVIACGCALIHGCWLKNDKGNPHPHAPCALCSGGRGWTWQALHDASRVPIRAAAQQLCAASMRAVVSGFAGSRPFSSVVCSMCCAHALLLHTRGMQGFVGVRRWFAATGDSVPGFMNLATRVCMYARVPQCACLPAPMWCASPRTTVPVCRVSRVASAYDLRSTLSKHRPTMCCGLIAPDRTAFSSAAAAPHCPSCCRWQRICALVISQAACLVHALGAGATNQSVGVLKQHERKKRALFTACMQQPRLGCVMRPARCHGSGWAPQMAAARAPARSSCPRP